MGWNIFLYCKKCLNYVAVSKSFRSDPETVSNFIQINMEVCKAYDFGIIGEIWECCDPPIAPLCGPEEICCHKLKEDLTDMFSVDPDNRTDEEITLASFKKYLEEQSNEAN